MARIGKDSDINFFTVSRRKRGLARKQITFVVRSTQSMLPKYFKSVAESAICFSRSVAFDWKCGSKTYSSRMRDKDKMRLPAGKDAISWGSATIGLSTVIGSVCTGHSIDPDSERSIFVA